LQTLFIFSEKENNRQKITGQKFRLTPDAKELKVMHAHKNSEFLLLACESK